MDLLGDYHAHYSGSTSGGVSSWNDLTDKPTTFPPEAHDHVIADVIGLEPRIFFDGVTYTFDIDITNADEGITDPYKFKTVYAAVLSILEILPRLPLNGDNIITMLLGDGDHYSTGFMHLFTYGVDGGEANAFLGIAGAAASANCRFVVESKSTPSNITTGEWSAISSTANYASEETAKFVANKALIESRFPCRIKPEASNLNSYYIVFPRNFSISGVAIVSDNKEWIYLTLPSIGAKPVAAIGCSYPYLDTTALQPLHSPYNSQPYNAEGFKLYVADGSCEVHSLAPIGTNGTVVLVNLGYPVANVQAAFDKTLFYCWAQFTCIGSIRYSYHSWIMCAALNTLIFNLLSGSSLKAGDVFLAIKDAYGCSVKAFNLQFGSSTSPSAIIRNDCNFPLQRTYTSLATLSAAFTLQGGFLDLRYDQTAITSRHLCGTGNPNGVMRGNLGDTYSNLSGGAGTTLWVKESGVNTNTGWVVAQTNPDALGTLSISSGVITLDCSLYRNFKVTLTSNVTSVVLTNLRGASNITEIDLEIKQDATGNRTFALPASFKALGTSDTGISLAANSVTVLCAKTFDNGTTWRYAMQESV
jgi:hypothetical protein